MKSFEVPDHKKLKKNYFNANDFKKKTDIRKRLDNYPNYIKTAFNKESNKEVRSGSAIKYNTSKKENLADRLDRLYYKARKMDDLALEAWKDHPNRVIIGNETDFEVKMRKAIQSVFEFLGDEKVEKFSKIGYSIG